MFYLLWKNCFVVLYWTLKYPSNVCLQLCVRSLIHYQAQKVEPLTREVDVLGCEGASSVSQLCVRTTHRCSPPRTPAWCHETCSCQLLACHRNEYSAVLIPCCTPAYTAQTLSEVKKAPVFLDISVDSKHQMLQGALSPVNFILFSELVSKRVNDCSFSVRDQMSDLLTWSVIQWVVQKMR